MSTADFVHINVPGWSVGVSLPPREERAVVERTTESMIDDLVAFRKGRESIPGVSHTIDDDSFIRVPSTPVAEPAVELNDRLKSGETGPVSTAVPASDFMDSFHYDHQPIPSATPQALLPPVTPVMEPQPSGSGKKKSTRSRRK